MESLISIKTQSWLSWFLRGVLFLGFLVLFGRIVELQIVKGNYYRSLAEENRIRAVAIPAPRGKILARSGDELVGNREVKKGIIFSEDSGYQTTDELTGREKEIISDWKREYLLGADFAHVSGYLGEVRPEEVGKVDPECPEKGPYILGAFVGRSGLEEEYNCLLSGTPGEELIEVDSGGFPVRILGRKPAIPGRDLKTNIDIELQKKVASELKGKHGAIVISDPEGQVLALFSSPSYDPNVFVSGKDHELIDSILNDSDLPLFNRVIGGLFHPGSVFKPIVAVGALAEGKIDSNYIYTDTGVIEIKTAFGDFSYSNWYFNQYGGVEGNIDVVRALARSTDTFFYKVGELLGVESIAKWATTFGFGESSGIDIPGEVGGLVPTPEWKKRVKNEQWFLGNTYHLAIGQGDLAVTPIEVNRATSAVATGKLCSPKIVGNGECKDLGIDKSDRNLVMEGMVSACQAKGTGYTFFDFENTWHGVRVGCKTGTAETATDGDLHAWFTVFAPVDYPEIVATVLVERGGEGSRVAGPIAREILDFWAGRRP